MKPKNVTLKGKDHTGYRGGRLYRQQPGAGIAADCIAGSYHRY